MQNVFQVDFIGSGAIPGAGKFAGRGDLAREKSTAHPPPSVADPHVSGFATGPTNGTQTYTGTDKPGDAAPTEFQTVFDDLRETGRLPAEDAVSPDQDSFADVVAVLEAVFLALDSDQVDIDAMLGPNSSLAQQANALLPLVSAHLGNTHPGDLTPQGMMTLLSDIMASAPQTLGALKDQFGALRAQMGMMDQLQIGPSISRPRLPQTTAAETGHTTGQSVASVSDRLDARVQGQVLDQTTGQLMGKFAGQVTDQMTGASLGQAYMPQEDADAAILSPFGRSPVQAAATGATDAQIVGAGLTPAAKLAADSDTLNTGLPKPGVTEPQIETLPQGRAQPGGTTADVAAPVMTPLARDLETRRLMASDLQDGRPASVQDRMADLPRDGLTARAGLPPAAPVLPTMAPPLQPIDPALITPSDAAFSTDLGAGDGGGDLSAREGRSVAPLGSLGTPSQVSPSLMTPAQAQQVTRQIAMAIQTAPGQMAEITLNPAELGHVRISLSSADAGMVVTIQADRPETLELMRRHADLLASDFCDIGYDTTSFSFEGSAGQNPNSDDRARDTMNDGRDSTDHPAMTDAADTSSTPAALRTGDGAIDIRL